MSKTNDKLNTNKIANTKCVGDEIILDKIENYFQVILKSMFLSSEETE